jgi:hypothetical protein
MRKELDRALCAKYPEIFRDRYGDARHTSMCWGFDCGDGWYNIIDSACAVIQHHINSGNSTQVVATQVKEKYGTLRFYLDREDEFISAVIAMAETMSGVTCETCGSPGTTRGRGWVRVLCDQHALEKGYE